MNNEISHIQYLLSDVSLICPVREYGLGTTGRPGGGGQQDPGEGEQQEDGGYEG